MRCFATHELCLITSEAVYLPFASTSNGKTSIVYGPLRSLRQIGELQELERRGWKIHYCLSTGVIGRPGDLQFEQELALYDGRCIIDDYTNIDVHGSLEDENWVTAGTRFQAKDDTGIEVALLGFE